MNLGHGGVAFGPKTDGGVTMSTAGILDAPRNAESESTTRVDIVIKSIREPAFASDGKRILVSQLWPQDVTRKEAALAEWRHDWAPSRPLLQWFGSSEGRWPEFCERYRQELVTYGRMSELHALAERAKGGRITLVYTDPNPERNVAAALLIFIRE